MVVTMPTPKVIDLSHHNVVPESLVPAAQSGILGVIHKLSEGTSHVDSKVDSRHWLANDAGMLWGLYHFIRPGDPRAQAEFFVRTAQEMQVCDDNTLWALDWEDKGVSAEDALVFLQTVAELTDAEPVLYSGHVCKEDPDDRLADYRLWLAQYASSCTLPSFAEKYWLWQYSEDGEVPGIEPPTDLNEFPGSDDELIATWSGQTKTDQPSQITHRAVFKLTVEGEGPFTVTFVKEPAKG
jgi:lysozyme